MIKYRHLLDDTQPTGEHKESRVQGAAVSRTQFRRRGDSWPWSQMLVTIGQRGAGRGRPWVARH